jgi:hypothetical protein
VGDANQRLYLERLLPSVDGPILEIGSRDYGNTQDFRAMYPGNEYTGVDLAAGPGVDLVVDLAAGIGDLLERHFALAICCSVLEHTPRPWVMAGHITRLVRVRGWLYMAVPWVWRYHPYPDDYFRFSHRAIESLFPAFDWADVVYTTNLAGESFEAGGPGFDDRLALYAETPAGKRKHLPYLQLHMLGLKTEE